MGGGDCTNRGGLGWSQIPGLIYCPSPPLRSGIVSEHVRVMHVKGNFIFPFPYLLFLKWEGSGEEVNENIFICFTEVASCCFAVA